MMLERAAANAGCGSAAAAAVKGPARNYVRIRTAAVQTTYHTFTFKRPSSYLYA